MQRAYTEDRSLDETLAFQDVVLVPRGYYHLVYSPPGYRSLYYLNVMADPVRERRIENGHEWLLE